jgi:ParB-like chromosome segregation protein Spo0J
MQVRDRVRELRRVKASELQPSNKNWRVHPDRQKNALRGALAEIGFADAVLARELPDGSLQLIDGHLRAETLPDMEIPVLVLDLDEAEADKLLLVKDPLAAMATADAAKLDALLRDINTSNADLAGLIADVARGSNLYKTPEPINPQDEWQGMPEYTHEDLTSAFRCIVHFANETDKHQFEELVEQRVPDNTKAIWYPKQERQVVRDKKVVSDEP